MRREAWHAGSTPISPRGNGSIRRFEITAAGTQITARLNGVLVTDYDGSGVLDDAMHQRYNVGLKGHIALQIHKADQLRIRFKDIVVRPLPAP